ncbi:S41 family peptidase [Aquimarina sp. ERC-38]|uniref:S41 family peptidase n=1 Tax=Aquimarina sp. ERC-38 TaxID=2949996 RepID=UPI0022481C76|nr:S41 family peptidase [Aquimarina sp. ERC-38]UZO79594.1 S41 family peptidase [Aquimarina sp. ERC-38]
MIINFNLKLVNVRKILFVLLVISITSIKVSAQEPNIEPVTPDELNTIVDSISAIVKRYYIKPEIGIEIVNRIRQKKVNNEYSQITNPSILKDSLKNDLRAINGDLHMNIVYRDPRNIIYENKAPTQVNEAGLWSNYGLNEIKVLEGNIGYLKIKNFTQHQYLENIKPLIANAFTFLKNTDALIIDVRNNGGGFEEMVAHYISYFFDSEIPIHLSDYRCTLHNHIYGISTDPNVSGPKLPNMKLYILVNANTGSAAESFAYIIKHLKRGTIIGEITAGAGNGASQHHINDRFSIQVSSEETINPITKTSFEKVGVIPHIKTTSKQAYNEAYKLALTYAREHNNRNIHPSNYNHLTSFIRKPQNSTVDSKKYLKYKGSYKSNTIHIKITLEDNVLYGQMAGNGGKMELTQLENHIFKVGEIKERIQFILNENGKVIQLKGLDSPMNLLKVSND